MAKHVICIALLLVFGKPIPLGQPADIYGVAFQFKGREHYFFYPMQRNADGRFLLRNELENARMDTLSNWFDPVKQYVEIVRQDNKIHPSLGLALGFEFDEENAEYPYTPAHAVIQLKDFRWGGVEFSVRDTMNYTGVSNQVSDDIQIEVYGFSRDTIWGVFSGALLNGAGQLSLLEGGKFKARLFRKKYH